MVSLNVKLSVVRVSSSSAASKVATVSPTAAPESSVKLLVRVLAMVGESLTVVTAGSALALALVLPSLAVTVKAGKSVPALTRSKPALVQCNRDHAVCITKGVIGGVAQCETVCCKSVVFIGRIKGGNRVTHCCT